MISSSMSSFNDATQIFTDKKKISEYSAMSKVISG